MDDDPSDDLKRRLGQKCREVDQLRSRFEKLSKENQNLTKFNEDLRDQIKLVTGKLNLHQKLDQKLEETTADSWSNVCPTCKSRLEQLPAKTASSQSWKEEAAAKRVKITDLVQEAAEQTCGSQDYVYDEKTRTYYSKSSGWYLYKDSGLFYDPNSRNYYRYDQKTKSYAFYSSLDDQKPAKEEKKSKNLSAKKKKKRKHSKKKKVKKSKKEDKEEGEADEEEGELSSSSSSSDSSEYDSDEFTVKLPPGMIVAKSADIKNDAKINPCIRMIVLESDGLELGSLLLVTCFGAQIGSDQKCDLHIIDSSVDEIHARISFDVEENCYWLRDLDSTAGTYVNDRLLDGVRMRIKHNDQIRLGRTKFLVHIHEKDRTCADCEPGCVQALFKQSTHHSSSSSSPKNTHNNRIASSSLVNKRREMKQLQKQLQKKYGLSQYSEAVSTTNGEYYSDRADERRRTKGSDCPYEKTDLNVTSSTQPIPQSNIGMKLLMKAGWSGPKPDDPNFDSRLIDVKANQERRGLGS